MADQSQSKIYTGIINSIDKFVPSKLRPLWVHPAGPKTVFFWAPLFKWSLVIAGMGDIINRPASKISINQTASLVISGLIWSRWSLIIKPKNLSLFAVNMFMSLTQSVQIWRAYQYQQEQQKAQAK